MKSIVKNTEKVLKEVKKFPAAFLVAVVKNREIEEIEHVLEAKPEIIAFSRVQEAMEKLPQLDFLGEAHMIGRLQKNKVKKAVELFDMIQSVDSLKLAKKINKEAERQEKKMPILLQINISDDPDKAGFSANELEKILQFPPEKGGEGGSFHELKNVEIQGLMTIGFRTEDIEKTRKTFADLKKLSDELLEKKLLPPCATDISMGMSNDYQIALEEGATLVRVGSGLFE